VPHSIAAGIRHSRRVTVPYVPLRVFSCFTMLEGAMEPKAIAAQAEKLGFPAVALTDRNGLYAAMPFTDACVAKGIQPVIGTSLAVACPAELGGAIDWLVLLAKDDLGYSNLCKLVSSAHLDRPLNEDPHIPFSKLDGLSDGLIVLTAGSEGALARLVSDGQSGKAKAYLDQVRQLFPDRLYIELIRRGDAVEQAAEEALIDLAYEHDLPLVATNPAAYLDPSFHSAHDAMLCIAAGQYVESSDRVPSSPEAWLKDGPAMAELFADVPEAIANTHQRHGLSRLLPDRRRLHQVGQGTQGIPVGPGRGSGAGSLVAWALTITDLDPIRLGLLFERFLNPERVSMPDFDIDFCETRRGEVIRYVQQKYGTTRSRRSSPSASSRRARCCATPAASCR
jgi:DNA polymerase III alpha subunit